MCNKKDTENARSQSYKLVSDSIKILNSFQKLHHKEDKPLPKYLSEALKLTEFYANSYAKFFSRDLELFLKIDTDMKLSAIEKTSINTYLNRKIFDTVAKLLYVSQLDVLDRGVFILAQLLGDIYFYSENNQTSEIYKKLDNDYREMGKNLLIKKKVKFPTNNTGLSRKYLRDNDFYFPKTEQILIELLPVYVRDHPNVSLNSKQLYKDYAMLSDAIHSGLIANYSTEYLSDYKDIAAISVRVRMMLEILNTYYFNHFLDKEVNRWLENFLSIKDAFLGEYLKVIDSD